MRRGDRVAGRWELGDPAPSGQDLERWRAVDAETGAPVEVVRPRVGQLDLAQRALMKASDPGLVRTIAVVEHEGWVVVRDPLEDADGTSIRGPLDPAAVAAIGARLIPAILAGERAMAGLFRPGDVGLGADGTPLLAPRPRAKGQVSGRDARYVAPESFGGRPPDGAAALHGLGVWLYWLVTGIEPAQLPATPSAIRRGIPPAVDRGVLALLSRDPNARAAALPAFLGAAGEIPDLRVVRAPKIEPVRVTSGDSRPQSRGRVDVADASWQVVIPTATLAQLTPEQRSVAAGFAEVPISTLEDVMGASLPLVLYSGRSRPEARAKALELETLTRLPLRVVTPIGCAPWLVGLAGIGLLPFAAAMLFFGPVAALLASFVPLVLIAVALWLLMSRRSASQQASRARELLSRVVRDSVTAPARTRIAQLRRRLSSADLPAAIAIDLRGGLVEIERHLDGLLQIYKLADDALTRMDLGKLRTRRDALSAEQTAERDRLARAIVDLEEVQARRERVRDEIDRVDASLDELEAAIGRASGDAPSEDVLERVLGKARLAALDPDAPPPQGSVPEKS